MRYFFLFYDGEVNDVSYLHAVLSSSPGTVHSLTALGVVLTAADHVSSLLASCSSSLYAMRVLRNHGLPATSLRAY